MLLHIRDKSFASWSCHYMKFSKRPEINIFASLQCIYNCSDSGIKNLFDIGLPIFCAMANLPNDIQLIHVNHL